MTYEELIRHMEWADAQVWRAVMDDPSAGGDAELKERLHHIHLVQAVWLQIWRGEEMKVRAISEFEDLEALLAWARSYYAELPAAVAGLSGDRLAEELQLPWRADLEQRFGKVWPSHVGESLTQVILHTMHHRAQVSTRLRALDVEPPMVDYLAWIWQGRPQTQWPEARGAATT